MPGVRQTSFQGDITLGLGAREGRGGGLADTHYFFSKVIKIVGNRYIGMP